MAEMLGPLIMALLMIAGIAPIAARAPGPTRPVGGPSLLQVLGYQPNNHRIYFEVWRESYDGDGSREIRYVDLSSRSPSSSIRDTALEPRRGEAPQVWDARVDRFRARLRLLLPMPVLGFELKTAVISADTLGPEDCQRRSRVRASMEFNAGEWSDTLTTQAGARVALAGIYRIPEPDSQLALILAYIRANDCWEEQSLAIVPKWWKAIGIE